MTADVMNGRPLSRIGEESNPSSPCSDVSVNSQLHVAGIRRSAVLPHSALTQFNTQTYVSSLCARLDCRLQYDERHGNLTGDT